MPPASPLAVTREGADLIVRTAAYTLAVRPERARAVLAGADGTIWSELSLIASVDRPDRVDESTALRPLVVSENDGEATIVLEAESTAWDSRTVTLRCTPGDVRVSVAVTGTGSIADVTLLGGRAALASGAAGEFRSSVGFASLFVPTPTNPVQLVRPAGVPAQIGVVGDAEPGRLHGIFSPPPLCFAFGRRLANGPTEMPAGDWLGVSMVAPVRDLGFTTARYDPLDGGFMLRLAYEGHTRVPDEGWTSPEIVLRPAGAPLEAIAHYRDELAARGWADGPASHAAWAMEPIFCGWGAQCAHAAALSRAGDGESIGADGAATDNADLESAGLQSTAPANPEGFVLPAGASAAPDMARQALYDRWLARLRQRDIRPGTIVIDDRWQLDYGTNTVDTGKWPDLRAWIAARHADGQRVLLWFKAWDPSGLPPELCVRDEAGRAVAVDPGNPDYLALLREQVTAMIGADGLDADGFKVDFTQRAPSGAGLRAHGDTDAAANGVWGVAALHALVATIHEAAKAAKGDALVVTHTVHPSFGGVTDMVRLNDVLEYDGAGAPVAVVDQLRFRHAIASAALPEHPIDTDQWPMPDREQWLAYAREQITLGVPALYYVESIDNSGEQITDADLDVIAQSWRRYRESTT